MKKKIFSIAIILIIFIFGSVLYLNKKIEQQKDPYNVSTVLDDKGVKLYRRGFRLLEEQLATYIKEHYVGVSEIKFSPIFLQGGDSHSLFSAEITLSIKDNSNNEAYLSSRVGNTIYATYGDTYDLRMDINGFDEEIIEIIGDNGNYIDVTKNQKLPPQAKLTSNDKIDENIEALIQNQQLKRVYKDQKGSSDAKVIYNDKIKKGDAREWR